MKRLRILLSLLLLMLMLPILPCAAETHPISLANETMQNLLTEQSDLFVDGYQVKMFGERATEKPFAHRFSVSVPIISYEFALRFSNAGGQINYGQRYRYYFGGGMEAAYRLIDTPTVYYVLYYNKEPVGLVSLHRCVGGYELESIDVFDQQNLMNTAVYLMNYLESKGISYNFLGCGTATSYTLVFTEDRYNGYVADHRLGGIHRTRDIALCTLGYLKEGDFGVVGIPRPGGGLEHITNYSDPLWVCGMAVLSVTVVLFAVVSVCRKKRRKESVAP